jgi:hypothetical protein
MTEGITHIERWSISIGDVLAAHLDGADMARLVEARVVGQHLVIDLSAEAQPIVGALWSDQRVFTYEQLSELRKIPEDVRIVCLTPAEDTPHAALSIVDDNSQADNQSAQEALPELELKGGPLARQAAIACQEGAFKFFVSEKLASPDYDPRRKNAGELLCDYLGITSRRLLDHDIEAAKRWRDLKDEYDLWMNS